MRINTYEYCEYICYLARQVLYCATQTHSNKKYITPLTFEIGESSIFWKNNGSKGIVGKETKCWKLFGIFTLVINLLLYYFEWLLLINNFFSSTIWRIGWAILVTFSSALASTHGLRSLMKFGIFTKSISMIQKWNFIHL